MKTQLLIIGGLLISAMTVSVLSENLNSKVIPTKKTAATPTLQKADDPMAMHTVTTSKSDLDDPKIITKSAEPEKCIFKTAFEGVGLEDGFYYKIPGKVVASMDKGLDWLESAQNRDGGWGAGSHGRQDIRDPHAVKSDPATTAMVAMALQRSG